MDRNQPSDAETFLLPSRRAALSAVVVGLDAGPLLITGAAGMGKTWLGRRLAEVDSPLGWMALDLAPGASPPDLVRALARGLGLREARDTGTLRLDIAEALAEAAADGRRWGLIVDEVQLAGVDLSEELRVLSNRLGAADGFGALVLIGQSSIGGRLTTRAFRPLASRLASKIHLGAIDADEAQALVEQLAPELAEDVDRVERWHRDSSGNPSLLRRMVAAQLAAAPVPPTSLGLRPARLGPDRPPIRVEEGLIEVGYDDEPTSVAEPTEPPAPSAVLVHDYHAALQARVEREHVAEAPEADEPAPRAEGPQGFAPYGQLFSRARQIKDANRS